MRAWRAPFVVLACVAGCSGPRTASWSFELETPRLETRAVEIEATILDGGCDGTRVLFTDRFAPTSHGVTPPVLGPGTYGFAGRAHDASCTWFASGCTEVRLPASEAVTMLAASTEVSDPGCASADAGRSDGSVDAAHDAGHDGGTDAGVDAARPSCATTFGGLSGFMLCIESATTCQFYVVSSSATCTSICAGRGSRSCIAQYDDDSAVGQCAIQDTIDCTATRSDTICECTR